jgi:hypothetical protein
MIERHYGALLDGAGADIARRLDASDLNNKRLAASSSQDLELLKCSRRE